MSTTEESNYAFIDGQNLYRGVKSLGWDIDWTRLHTYLREKYSVTKAHIFIGYVSEFEWLYTILRDAGFILMFKPTIKNKDGSIKGNVDGDMILYAILEYENYNKAIIITSDGDFYSLVDYLYKKQKLQVVISPYGKTCSVLLKKTARERIVFMDNLEIRIGKTNNCITKRKAPPED